MAKINHINMEWTDNTAWFSDCDGMIDYFPHNSGSLKYIIGCVIERGADKIEVTVTNNDPTIPAQKRVNRICKECGYKATNNSHMHTYANGTQSMVYTWELVKVREVPIPPEPEHIYLPDQVLTVGDIIQNKYGDTFKVVSVGNNYVKTIKFCKLMKNGSVGKKQYSGPSYNYRKIEA